MESVLDYETGEETILRDITMGSFESYADTGPSYSSQRDQAKAEMAELYKNAQGTQGGQYCIVDLHHIARKAQAMRIFASGLTIS